MVRDLLSGLDDRDIARKLASKHIDNVRRAVEEALTHSQRADFLRPHKKLGKTAALEGPPAIDTETMREAFKELVRTFSLELKETRDQLVDAMKPTP